MINEDIKNLIEHEKEVMLAEQDKQDFALPVEVTLNNKIENVTAESDFSKTVESGMIEMLKEAHITDEGFRSDMLDKIKESATQRADLEKDKAELERQNLQYQSELLGTQQLLNKYQQEDDGYNAKRNRRQFIYDGVKPIMKWIGIEEPMNVVLMCILTAVLVIPFIICKPLTALLIGVDALQRKKQAVAWLWTLLAVFVTGIILTAVLVPLSYFGKI